MKFNNLIILLLKLNLIHCKFCFDPNPIFPIISIFFHRDQFFTYTTNGTAQEFNVMKLSNPNDYRISFKIENYLHSIEINYWYIFKQLSFAVVDNIYLIAAEHSRNVGIESIKIYRKYRGIGNWIQSIIKAEHAILISSFNFSLKVDKIPYLIIQNNLDIKIKFIINKELSNNEDFICIYDSGSHLIINIQLVNCTEKYQDYFVFNFMTKFQFGFIYNDHIYLLSANKNLVFSFNYVELDTKEFTELIEHKLSDMFICKLSLSTTNLPTNTISSLTEHWPSMPGNITDHYFNINRSKILLILILSLILFLLIIRIYKMIIRKKQIQIQKHLNEKNRSANILKQDTIISMVTMAKKSPKSSILVNKTFKSTSKVTSPLKTESVNHSTLTSIISSPKTLQHFKSDQTQNYKSSS